MPITLSPTSQLIPVQLQRGTPESNYLYIIINKKIINVIFVDLFL